MPLLAEAGTQTAEAAAAEAAGGGILGGLAAAGGAAAAFPIAKGLGMAAGVEPRPSQAGPLMGCIKAAAGFCRATEAHHQAAVSSQTSGL